MNKASAVSSSYAQFIVVLMIFVGVLALTYFVTRYISEYQKGRRAGTNIELIESAPLGTNKYIQLVRIGKSYIAVAVCKDSVTKLAEIPDEDVVLSNDNSSVKSFKEILSRAKSFNEEDENE